MSAEETKPARPRPWLAILPLAVFAGLSGVFLIQLLSGRDMSEVPSALIGAKAPQTTLPPVDGLDKPGLDSTDFAGRVTVLNVWASWCAPCREEHPLLMALSADRRFALVGLNYKDDPANARRFLGDLGDPFAAVGSDRKGRTAIDWGVYGVPETFVIGKDGTIRFKHVGPLDDRSLQTVLMPQVEKALASP